MAYLDLMRCKNVISNDLGVIRLDEGVVRLYEGAMQASKEHNQDWYNGFIKLGNGVIMSGKGVIRLD